MVYKVLIVDDSTFYRRRVRQILNEDRELEVIGEARDGREALEKVKTLKPDVVTMDVEMPVMDGISAVKSIMDSHPVPILMFSSLTHQGAQATLDALHAGALDFLPKKFEDIAQDRKEASTLLRAKVRLIARRGAGVKRAFSSSTAPSPTTTSPSRRPLPKTAPKQQFFRSSGVLTGRADAPVQQSVSSVTRTGKRYQCLAIGASTGGPVALQKVLTALPANFPYPIILVQHMPGTFTTAFAERLNNYCKIKVKEAVNGDTLEPGCAYLAPGGRQLVAKRDFRNVTLQVCDVPDKDKVGYKPSVDITFSSLAKVYSGDVLGVILTGMGADGREGCRELQQLGATIWAQDQASCVVYGMPQAVAAANISQKSISLDAIGSCILTELQH